MVEEASKYEAEDKALMGRVEARNRAEGYLYQTKSAVGEEKLKATLGDGVAKIEEVVKDGLAWLEDNRDAEQTVIEDKQKEWEAVINPLLSAAAGGSSDAPADASVPEPGPKIEEVD